MLKDTGKVKGAYYNEIDPFAAAWLRGLIKAGHIAPGEVDERSIEDVVPDDLAGFAQHHFFAGIGAWSYALRLAGWPDGRPVWTGSCPCQPFSAAGKGGGFADERHLWPAFFHLISQCRPVTVFGEQVASKDGLTWLDLVQSDLEGAGYACGAVDSCSAGFGAPHIRQRLYWVADAMQCGRESQQEKYGISRALDAAGPTAIESSDTRDSFLRLADSGSFGQHGWRPSQTGNGGSETRQQLERFCDAGSLANPTGSRHDGAFKEPEREAWDEARLCLSGTQCGACRVDNTVSHGRSPERNNYAGYVREQLTANGDIGGWGIPDAAGCETGVRNVADAGGLEHAGGQRRERRQKAAPGYEHDWSAPGGPQGEYGAGLASAYRLSEHCPGPVNGLWRSADWLFCRDGKWRPVESGTFPLAHGAAARVGRLRGYGNAINPWQAKAFIEAYMEWLSERALREVV